MCDDAAAAYKHLNNKLKYDEFSSHASCKKKVIIILGNRMRLSAAATVQLGINGR
jgi:hypothetical protein